MYERIIAPHILNSLNKYPIVTIIGPRQSGKTTLARHLFPHFQYYSLEDPDIRNLALNDPRSFLNSGKQNIILDEIQRVPQLTSYLQTIVDAPTSTRKFVLSGSNSTLLMDSVSQSLARRTELFELLPLSIKEIRQKNSCLSLNQLLLGGGYPRIYQQDLNPTKWHKGYFQLYVEKDIRQITNISNIEYFEKFVRLSAGRVGQLINASSLANEVGVSSPTIKSWILALKSIFICFTLAPHFRNFGKRLIKTPKLYFYDSGLLCYLLGINSIEQLTIHPLRGNIFENFIVSEYLKQSMNQGKEINLYFWRDQKGYEVDLVEDRSTYLYPIEIMLGETFNQSFLKNLEYLNDLQKNQIAHFKDQGMLIYSGQEQLNYKNINLCNWFNYFS